MSRRDGAIDSDIEQQLSENDELFARMAMGVEDDEPEAIEEEVVEEVEDEEVEVEEEEEYEDDSYEDDEDIPTERHSEDEDEDDLEVPTKQKPPKTTKSKIYTPEELKELLRDGDFSQVDTSRLSEEGKLVMKSMQSGLTPKLQEAAELRKELAALREDVAKALPKPKPKDIYEAHDQDPDGVDRFIEAKIDEAIEAGDQVTLEKMKEYRERIRLRSLEKKVAPQQEPSNDIQVVANQLLRAIPDIESVQNDLKKYAIEVMGYDEQELAENTNLTRGASAVREIVRIKNAYDKYIAPRTAQSKAKKKRPVSVEKSGGGFKKNETTIKDLKHRAIKSGNRKDWLSVFEAMED